MLKKCLQLNQLSICLSEILHANRETIDMKQIKQYFSFEGQGSIPWDDIGGLIDAINQLFQNIVMLHIILTRMMHTMTC